MKNEKVIYLFLLTLDDGVIFRKGRNLRSIYRKKGMNFLTEAIKRIYNISHDKIQIAYDLHGKPYIEGEEIYFNVAYSKNNIALIISDSSSVGVDIEHFDYAHNLKKLANRFFSKEELSFVKAQSKIEEDMEILRIWTLKEAMFKTGGTGLSNLIEMESYFSYPDWLYHNFIINRCHVSFFYESKVRQNIKIYFSEIKS